jgi:hypothetical protein
VEAVGLRTIISRRSWIPWEPMENGEDSSYKEDEIGLGVWPTSDVING